MQNLGLSVCLTIKVYKEYMMFQMISFVFDLGKECHPDYVAEKLYIDSRSAKFVIDFVQSLFNRGEI